MRGLLLLTLLSLGACWTPAPTRSGFLDDYDQLQPDPHDPDALVWFAARGVLAPYEDVLVDPVEFHGDAGDAGFRAADLVRVEEELLAALQHEATGTYTLVDEPGESVLRLRVAVTRLVPTRPVLNLATQVPPARAASLASKLLLGTHLGVGQISIEAELLDSISGEPLARYADVHVGKKLELVDGVVRWAQMRDGLRGWARRLREQLERARGERP